MWCLACLLPLMIREFVPDGDANWKNFLLLWKIVNYVFSPVTTRSIAAYLTTLIEDFESFEELYSECSVIPKEHYYYDTIPQWMVR